MSCQQSTQSTLTQTDQPLTKLAEVTQAEVPLVRKGPTTRSGARVLRGGFSKAVQEMLDQDQTGLKLLLIQELSKLENEDQSGPIEVQDQSGPIQFSFIVHNQNGLTISTFDLGSTTTPNPSGSGVCKRCSIYSKGMLDTQK